MVYLSHATLFLIIYLFCFTYSFPNEIDSTGKLIRVINASTSYQLLALYLKLNTVIIIQVFVKMQINTDKQLTELDNFLLRNNQQPTPRRSYLSNQPAKNQQHLKQHNQKENQPLITNNSRSPARSASKKTLSSHDNSQSSLSLSRQRAKSRRSCKVLKRHCENHEELDGAYRINIQGEDLFYCEKCAIKLKSQGFPVKLQNINSRNSRTRLNVSQGSTMLTSYPHLEGHPQFQVLKLLLSSIYESEHSLKKAASSKQSVEEIYQHISEVFEGSMDKIEEIIQFHRVQGRKLLKKLFYDYQKIPINEQNLISQSLQEIQIMKNDIEGNIESIVQDVDESTFQQCVESYRQRIEQLNRLSAINLNNIEEIKQQFHTIHHDTFATIKADMERALSQTMKSKPDPEESMLCNQGLMKQKPQVENNGAFRNLFDPAKANGRKRGVSKK